MRKWYVDRLYWPKWSVWRALRIAVYTAVIFSVIEIANTTPYLGLPFEPKPIFLDCYESAVWTGKVFVGTGKMICLGETTSQAHP